jgi:hypothetical protein
LPVLLQLLQCALAADFTIPLFAFGLYTGADKREENKIISVLFITSNDSN